MEQDASITTTRMNLTSRTTIGVGLVLLGALLIITVQFYRVPEEQFLDVNISCPRVDCAPEWFPARHWTQQSKLSPVANATHPGKQMFGTIEAQHAIWSHQHPSSCNGKKFLVYAAVHKDHGIGSVIHVLGVALQAALNLDRILILMPQPDVEWNTGKYCEGMDTIDECYFEPLSSCTVLDAFGALEISNENLKKFSQLNPDTYSKNSERVLQTSVKPLGDININLRTETPTMFHTLLQTGGIKEDFYYWWRAQSTAYIVRPSLRTLRELGRRRKLVFDNRAIQPGTVSVHIRHGDKWKEDKLADDASFLRSMEALMKRNRRGLKRRIFLSTDDPISVKFFAGLSNWTVEYTNVSRDAYMDRTVGPEDFAAKIGWDEEFLNSLLSLQLATECDGFVGAMYSNWNRLIDELRSTVRCKYDVVSMFVDVNQGFNVTNFGW